MWISVANESFWLTDYSTLAQDILLLETSESWGIIFKMSRFASLSPCTCKWDWSGEDRILFQDQQWGCCIHRNIQLIPRMELIFTDVCWYKLKWLPLTHSRLTSTLRHHGSDAQDASLSPFLPCSRIYGTGHGSQTHSNKELCCAKSSGWHPRQGDTGIKGWQ